MKFKPENISVVIFACFLIFYLITDLYYEEKDFGCYEINESIPVFSLNMMNSIEGDITASFLLGTGGLSGQISTQKYYITYKKNKQGDFELFQISAKDVPLRLQDNETPRYVSIKQNCTKQIDSLGLDPYNETSKKEIYNYLVVPTNTIKIKYEVN